MSQPSFFLTRWLLRISERIEDSLFVRVPLTIVVLLLLYVMSSQVVVGIFYISNIYFDIVLF